MDFEWDEAKRLSNIIKHGFDFLRAEAVFDEPHFVAPARQAAQEKRWSATGVIEGLFVTVIYTERGNNIRIISMRRARQHEQRRYQELYSH